MNQFKIGDRLRLPPTLSQPGGEYRIVSIAEGSVRLRSKDGVERYENAEDLPSLLCRARPVASTPITSDTFRRDDGVLSAEGYHVGMTAGLAPNRRQIVLRRVFNKPATELLVGGDEIYRAEWGEARSEARLAKIIRCLESFINLHWNRGRQYRKSISDWIADLTWLDEELREPNGFKCYPMDFGPLP